MGVALAGGFALVTGLQLGRSLANLVAGAGWTWPDPDAGQFASPIGTAFWTSLPGVVTGDSSAGLAQHQASSDRLAGTSLTWGCLIVTDLLVVIALGWLAIFVLQRWGPGRMRGMATSAEAERMLGVTRLRKVAGIVRPDLHDNHAAAPAAPVEGTAGDLTEQPGPQLGHGLNPWLLDGRRTQEHR